MKIDLHDDGNLAISLPTGHYLHDLCKALPKRRWLPARKLWVTPPILSIMEYIKKYMPHLEWSQEAEQIYGEKVAEEGRRKLLSTGNIFVDISDLDGVPFKLPPREAQKKALLLGSGQKSFAYLMDQGTGKTKVILDDAAINYRAGKIDCLIVLAPNSVKTNWVSPFEDKDDPDTWDEVTKHMAPDIEYVKAAWFANPRQEAKRALNEFEKALSVRTRSLLVFAANVDGINTARAFDFLAKIVSNRKVMIAVDESTRIATHTSQRHKNACELRNHCVLARIASGTPVLKSPLKAYGQFKFLDPNIINIPTWTEFKARYSVANPNNPNHIIKFVNTDELSERIAGASFRVLKSECLDLPPKEHTRRNVYLSPKQEKAYNDMREECIVHLDNLAKAIAEERGIPMEIARTKVSVSNVMTQMLRLQQITSGYLPIINDKGEMCGEHAICDGPPPKIAEAVDIIEECDHKVIVWCRFKFEVREMAKALKKANISHVTFFGETPERDRIESRQRFLSDPNLKVFVGQINTGGVGLNLYTANTVIYLSNTFSTEDRLQSEDRAHRHGQTGSVMYIDLIAPKTVDERVIKVLRNDKTLSDSIMRDGYQKWL